MVDGQLGTYSFTSRWAMLGDLYGNLEGHSTNHNYESGKPTPLADLFACPRTVLERRMVHLGSIR